MSTTVTYKGNTLTTVSNATKTLKTAGKYMEGDVILTDVSAETSTIQSLSITPSESEQTFDASTVDGYKPVTVSAISSTYIGSGITRRSSTDLTVSGATITAPAGYYSAAASKSVASGSASAPSSISGTSASISTGTNTLTLTKTVSVTPVVSAGYVSSGTATNSSVSLTASIPVNPTVTASGATVTIPTGYYTTQIIKSVASGSATAPSTISGTAASVSTGNGTLTLTKTVSVTPSVTAGYVSSGTAGNSSVSLTASVTIDPTPTASGATVTIPAGYYTEATSKAVTTMTLPTSAASSATSGYTKKATISRSTSTQYINIAPGYNSAGGYYEISATPNGSAKTPATTITANPTITISDSGLITATASASQNITPTVSAGYVSSGTAGTITVSGSKTQQLTTKAAATITPTTTNQTIAAGTYLTGIQTIAGDADLVGSNILSTANIFGVQGTVDFIDVYIRSAAPTSSVGNDGDIYIQE